MTFRDTVLDDLHRYFGRTDSLAFLKAFCRIPAFRFTFWLRAAAALRSGHGTLNWIAYLFCRFFLDHYSIKYGYQIQDKTDIGSGLYIGHFGYVVINSEVKIGRNVNLAVGVTIGQSNRGPHAGNPILGDRVWVGANAIVVGAIKIGEGALIAPGAYVNFDVPANAVVLGNPGKIVSFGGTESYVGMIRDSPIAPSQG